MSPLQQRTAPDLYPYSLEATIKERGVNRPAGMMEADEIAQLTAAETENANYQLEARTRVVEELLEQAQIDSLRQRFNQS